MFTALEYEGVAWTCAKQRTAVSYQNQVQQGDGMQSSIETLPWWVWAVVAVVGGIYLLLELRTAVSGRAWWWELLVGGSLLVVAATLAPLAVIGSVLFVLSAVRGYANRRRRVYRL